MKKKKPGNGFSLTLERLIRKDINVIPVLDVHLKEATGIVSGPNNRSRYVVRAAIILENISKGYFYALTAQLSKAFAKGFYGSIAYTFTQAKDSMFPYHFDYASHASSNPSLIFEGAIKGNINYRINGDMNSDDKNQDLMYPQMKTPDLTIEAYSATVTGPTYNFTTDPPAAASDKFINNSPYLNKRRGRHKESNPGIAQWYPVPILCLPTSHVRPRW